MDSETQEGPTPTRVLTLLNLILVGGLVYGDTFGTPTPTPFLPDHNCLSSL